MVLDKKQQLEDCFQYACKNNWIEVVKLLVREGVDPNSAYGFSAACRYGFLEVVQYLVDSGVDPNSQEAFYTACSCGETDVVKYLLDSGVSPKTKYALKTAAYNNRVEVVVLLLRSGSIDPFDDSLYNVRENVLRIAIKYGVVTEEWLEKNKRRIPSEIWEQVYE